MARPQSTVALITILLGSASVAPSSTASAPAVPACVQSQAQSRYLGFAYDHIVLINNRCDKAASCSVTTSSNPEPIHATVDANQAREVLTFRANPARTFTYELRCTLER
jgi:hypothetical protein